MRTNNHNKQKKFNKFAILKLRINEIKQLFKIYFKQLFYFIYPKQKKYVRVVQSLSKFVLFGISMIQVGYISVYVMLFSSQVFNFFKFTSERFQESCFLSFLSLSFFLLHKKIITVTGAPTSLFLLSKIDPSPLHLTSKFYCSSLIFPNFNVLFISILSAVRLFFILTV